MNFIINLHPMYWPEVRLGLSKIGSKLTLTKQSIDRNGSVLSTSSEEIDFAGLPEGGDIAHWDASALSSLLVGPISREGDTVSLTLILPHQGHAPGNVDPLTVSLNGTVAVPTFAPPPDNGD